MSHTFFNKLLEQIPAMYFVYSLLFVLGAIVLAPYYAWRYRKTPLLRASWRDRLGWISARPARPGSIWVHAVSVGETLAVAGLVEQLAARFPGREIFISHVTPTGREAGEKRLPQLAGRFFLPLDLAGPMRRAMRRLRPALLIIVETELWPHLLRAAHQAGARVALVNARLSDRSFRGYRLGRPLMRRVLEDVDLIMAQTPGDAGRFREIGAAPERVGMAGNLKFDSRPPGSSPIVTALKPALAGAGRAPVLVAASTMPGEEELVLRVWNAVRERYPQALLILVPRHPARFDQVARLLEQQAGQGREYVRRAALATDSAELLLQLARPSVLLLDTLGELQSVFELADVVFIGGSLVPTGGHNLLEPAWWAKPVIFGPHMENFRDAARIFLKAGGAVQAQDADHLGDEILNLFGDEARRKSIGQAARAVIERESGATARILERLAALLGEESVSSQPSQLASEAR
ncbi:MAG TPA: 3-deoxy-D-manno-octulosonic acid transferase [Terriglobia bacterium]|nr:3-deoxy-D-manno-octulosonic acid transferase [Terriglobia bacterium]